MFIYKIWHTEKKQAKPTFTQLHGQIVYTIDQWVHSVAIWILVIQNAACKAANGVNNTHRLGNFVAALRRHWRYIEDILFFSCIWLQMYHLVWKLPMFTTFYAIRCHKQQAWTQQTKRAFFSPHSWCMWKFKCKLKPTIMALKLVVYECEELYQSRLTTFVWVLVLRGG